MKLNHYKINELKINKKNFRFPSIINNYKKNIYYLNTK